MVALVRLLLLVLLAAPAADAYALLGRRPSYCWMPHIGTPDGKAGNAFGNRPGPRSGFGRGTIDGQASRGDGRAKEYGRHRGSGRSGAEADATRLAMGLYDEPLPPRPPPVPPNNKRGRQKDSTGPCDDDEDDDDDDDEDDDEYDVTSERGDSGASAGAGSARINLFAFNEKGGEVNGLLPNLGRRLDRGVECYYEPTDRVVQSLVRRTSCSPVDACWALEACKGDVTEAWTRISVARRTNLEDKRLITNSNDEEDSAYQVLDADVLELEMEEEFLEMKERRNEEQRKRDVQDLFKGGTKDQDWLPGKPKGPVDDEPWFTG